MRAEPPYVETLARPRADQPIAPPAPVVVAAMSATAVRPFGVVSEALARTLDSVHASLAELQAPGRPLRERVCWNWRGPKPHAPPA
jgi:hypothetical protein